jgi:amino acid adenylation domain-containing protein
MNSTAGNGVLVREAAAPERPTNKGVPAGPPLFRRRPATTPERTETITVELSKDLLRLLSSITRDEPLLEYASMAAALNVCLFKYSRASAIALGAPALKGTNTSDSDVVVMVNELNGQMTFRQLLLAVRQNAIETYAASRKSCSEERACAAPQDPCLHFNVALVVPTLHSPMPEVNHDITLTFFRGAPAKLEAHFSPDLYIPEIIEFFCGHILKVLKAGLEKRDFPISELPMLSEVEMHRLTEWNNSAKDYVQKCIHEIFEEHAGRQPESAALVCGDRRLSYRELNEQANQVAHYLRKQGIGGGALVGVFLNRSIEQVVGILGVLKAGAAYVPYDPTYPKERLTAMFEDLKPMAVLTSEKLAHRFPHGDTKVVRLDADAEEIARESTAKPEVFPQKDDLCYVIFTSGSTGRAKAAAVHHGGWNNLLNWFVNQFNVSPADKTLVMSSISFDITQRAMAMPLMQGAELHLVPSQHYEPELILSTIEKEKITLLNCAPSTFYPMIEGADAARRYQSLRSLRCLFLGGEAISASRLKNWAMSAECSAAIVNVYGAAECSDVSSFYILRDFDHYVAGSVPIGTPIYNTQIYLVDEDMQLVPIGVPGEICLSGNGVGKGYINDALLTARKFPENPFAGNPGSRIYRTGDVGRYRPDGVLEFMGRVDNQVKIRGQRVELGDIEAALRQDARVSEAVVIQAPFTNDFQRLIAYVIPKQPAGGQNDKFVDELREAVATRLPLYMVPNAFVVLDELPLNPNGKVDRAALPVPAIVRSTMVVNPPATPTEKTLAAFYTKLLGIENVGVTDNFFDLGGHSLLVTQMLALIGDEFKLQVLATDFYKDPTISGLAKAISAQLTAARPAAAS